MQYLIVHCIERIRQRHVTILSKELIYTKGLYHMVSMISHFYTPV